MSPTFVNNASPSMLPTFLNNASPSDEEQEQHLFTHPEAEAIDLPVELGPPKRKATTQGKTHNKKTQPVELDPPKRKATTQGRTHNKKKQYCDTSNVNLDAQLKQVRDFNANDSLFHASDSLLQAATVRPAKVVNQVLARTRPKHNCILL